MRNLNTGDEYDEIYNLVLLSPDAEPIPPRPPEIESQRVFGLRNIPGLDCIMRHLDETKPRLGHRRWLYRYRGG